MSVWSQKVVLRLQFACPTATFTRLVLCVQFKSTLADGPCCCQKAGCEPPSKEETRGVHRKRPKKKEAKEVEKQWIEHWAFESYTSDEDANSTRYHCATSPIDVGNAMSGLYSANFASMQLSIQASIRIKAYPDNPMQQILLSYPSSCHIIRPLTTRRIIP